MSVASGTSALSKAALHRRLEGSGRLPTPPGVVLKLLEQTRSADVSADEIASTISQDPGLSAKILRFANSPLAGLSREVTSLQQAVALIGVRGIKMMALSFSVLTPHDQCACKNFSHEHFALQSFGCGVAARILSEMTHVAPAQEAFLAGLLSQIGRLVFASGMPEEYAHVLTSAQRIPIDLPELERQRFGQAYPQIGAWLLRTWGIPDTLCTAVDALHTSRNHPQRRSLTDLLHTSELAAAALCPDKVGQPVEILAFVKEVRHRFGLDRKECVECLQQISKETAIAGRLLKIPVKNLPSAEQIEASIRERLAELGIAMHLENQSMAVQQQDLLRRATTDSLTGIGNRAAFDARLNLEIRRSQRSHNPLSLLMIDVDRFKNFNDTYGHQAGDRVLHAVARLLNQNVRKVDYLARYGGEEFVVVTPGACESDVAIMAERLRTAVEGLSVDWDGQALGVTISIGGVVYEDGTLSDDSADIIRAADGQLYEAKYHGRNRVQIVTERGPAHAAP